MAAQYSVSCLVRLFAHGIHLRRATERRLPFRADADQRFWPSLRRRLEHGYWVLILRHFRKVDGIRARRMANDSGRPGTSINSAENDRESGCPQSIAAG